MVTCIVAQALLREPVQWHITVISAVTVYILEPLHSCLSDASLVGGGMLVAVQYMPCWLLWVEAQGGCGQVIVVGGAVSPPPPPLL